MSMNNAKVTVQKQDETHIIDIPILRSLFYGISWLYIKMTGWKIVGVLPDEKRMMAIAAPHTSNWDFPLFMALAGIFRMRIRFLGKHTLFKPPMGWLFRLLGGLPVERETAQASGMLKTAVKIMCSKEKVIMAIAPEGTRGGDGKWKTGFYRIAVAAGVPILIAFLDASKKEVGFHGLFYPTGDMEADMAKIQAVYTGKIGINPPA